MFIHLFQSKTGNFHEGEGMMKVLMLIKHGLVIIVLQVFLYLDCEVMGTVLLLLTIMNKMKVLKIVCIVVTCISAIGIVASLVNLAYSVLYGSVLYTYW